MALVLSGLPVHSFTFRGFPPRKSGARKRWLEVDLAHRILCIFYESPYRLIDFMTDAKEVFGDRRGAVANDLTKKFEMVYRGTISEVMGEIQKEPLRGEVLRGHCGDFRLTNFSYLTGNTLNFVSRSK
jgi:16S rRNA (cytidine1402-2'-O)-methyltransferase